MFQVLGLFNIVCAKESKYLTNFKPGTDFTTVGPESVVTDYVTIANDPVSDLPNAFTICSSLFIEIYTTDSKHDTDVTRKMEHIGFILDFILK